MKASTLLLCLSGVAAAVVIAGAYHKSEVNEVTRNAQAREACILYSMVASASAEAFSKGASLERVQSEMAKQIKIQGMPQEQGVLTARAIAYAHANYRTTVGNMTDEYMPVCIAHILANYR